MIEKVSGRLDMVGEMRALKTKVKMPLKFRNENQNVGAEFYKNKMENFTEDLTERTGQRRGVGSFFSQHDTDGTLRDDESPKAFKSIREDMWSSTPEIQGSLLNSETDDSAASYAMRLDTGRIIDPVDQNSDGIFDTSEIQALADKIAERTGQTVDVENLFSQYDSDTNGTLSADEFNKALKSIKNTMRSAEMQTKESMLNPEIISSEDQNSDGSIDKTEMQAFADKIAERTGQSISVEDLFSQYDSDADGTLNVDEAIKAFASLLKGIRTAHIINPADLNSDGNIDKTEMQAFADKISERTGQSISVEDLFYQYDSNSDGALSSEEAIEVFKSICEKIKPENISNYERKWNYGMADSNYSPINVIV
jgi:Ca2+-binding EF-hand superfamily protein